MDSYNDMRFTAEHKQWKQNMNEVFRDLLLRHIPGGSRVVYLDSATQGTTRTLQSSSFALFVANCVPDAARVLRQNPRLVCEEDDLGHCLMTHWQHHSFQGAWFDACTSKADVIIGLMEKFFNREFDVQTVVVGYTLSSRSAGSLFSRCGDIRRFLRTKGTFLQAENMQEFSHLKWQNGQMATEFFVVRVPNGKNTRVSAPCLDLSDEDGPTLHYSEEIQQCMEDFKLLNPGQPDLLDATVEKAKRDARRILKKRFKEKFDKQRKRRFEQQELSTACAKLEERRNILVARQIGLPSTTNTGLKRSHATALERDSSGKAHCLCEGEPRRVSSCVSCARLRHQEVAMYSTRKQRLLKQLRPESPK